MRFASLLAIVLVIALAPTTRAQAMTFTVSNTMDTGGGSLRQAILDANSNLGADTISISATGTISLTTQLPDLGQDVTITGPGSASLTVDVAGHGAGFIIEVGVTASISGLKVMNANGGGIVDSGALTLTDVVLASNSRLGANQAGGGLNLQASASANLSHVTITGNQSLQGGGIRLNQFASIIMDSTLVTLNTATTGIGGGIAAALDSTATITNSTFSSNSSTLSDGGGLYNNGTMTIDGSTISGNTAVGGAGLYDLGTLTMTNSTFSDNTATGDASTTLGGGGAMESVGTVSMTNVTLSNNSSGTTHKGGAINNCNARCTATTPGSLTLLNVTLFGNSNPDATSGGGVFNDSGATLTMKNTIVAGSQTGGNCSGSITSQGHNLSTDASCVFAGTGDKNSAAPNLGPLANYGGGTLTQAPIPISAAIDAGDNSGCPTRDQRGVTRLTGSDTVCDIGAVEYDGVDTDGDGYTDIQEDALSKNPLVYCAIMRADVDTDHSVSILDLAATAAHFLQTVGPSNARYNQDNDTSISILDLAAQASHFLQNVSACP